MKATLTICCGDCSTHHLVHFDEDRACLSEGEKPIDLVMEILTRATHPREAAHVLRPLQNVGTEGLSHVRACLLPGALSTKPLVPGFQPRTDHQITVSIQPETKTRYGSADLSLDGAEPIDLSSSDFRRAAERDGDPATPLFSDRAPRHPEPLRYDQIASGAVLTGYFSKLFAERDQIARSTTQEACPQLVGVLAALAGYRFATWQNRDEIDWVLSSTKTQYQNFLRNGYLVSDRGWNARCHLEGPRLEDARREAPPELMAFSAAATELIKDLDATYCLQLCRALITEFGMDPGNYSSRFEDCPPLPGDNHALLIFSHHLERLRAFISAHPAPPQPAMDTE